MATIESRVAIPEIISPLFRYSLTPNLKQVIAQPSIRLETGIKIVLQMVPVYEAVVKVKPETLGTALDI